jgi:hypothetical protein
MSNRFNQWSPTEYVPMPVDYYQQALGTNESLVQNQVDQAKQSMYALRSVTPTGKNAEALHEQIMNSINSDIEAVGKENLNTPEALSKINSIVSNPQYIGKLRQIYSMTEEAKKAHDTYVKSVETNGNDVNAVGYLKATKSLYGEQGDPSQFNSNLFTGTDVIPKYIEIQPEVDKAIEHMKASGYTDVKTGKYITTKEVEQLTPERIKAAAISQLQSRTDLALQLQHNVDYSAFQAGGLDKVVSSKLPAIQAELDKTNAALTLATKDRNSFARKYGLHGDQIDQAIRYYKELAADGTETLQNIDNPQVQRQILINDSIGKHAKASSDLFSYYKEKLNIKADPYELQREGAALDLNTWKQKKAIEFEMFTKMANDQTDETQMGTSGALSGSEKDDLVKDKNGTWIKDLGIEGSIGNNGVPTPFTPEKNQTVGDNMNPMYGAVQEYFYPTDKVDSKHLNEQVINKAKEMGWNGTSDIKAATDFLHQAWAKNRSVSMPAYFNPSMDNKSIGTVLSSAFNGLSISKGGSDLVGDDPKRLQVQNDIMGFLSDKATSGTVGSTSSFMTTVNPRTHKLSFTYTDPRDGQPVYIEMPSGWKRDFGNVEGLTKSILDPNYKNGSQSVNYGGKPYTLFRLPESGTSEVVGVADTNEIGITRQAHENIMKVANTLYHNGLSYVDAIKEARTAINKQAAKVLANRDLLANHFIVDGVNLGDTPFMVLNDINGATDINPQRLQIGTLIPTPGADGKPYNGSIIPAGDLMRGLMSHGVGERVSKQKKFTSVTDAQTTSGKQKFSFTNADSESYKTSNSQEE